MRSSVVIGGAIALAMFSVQSPVALVQQQAPQFGGDYSALDARRQRLVENWVGRFVKTTGQRIDPGVLYDTILSLSAKTTFEAVTHALMTSALTDQSGASLGDALALVDQVDAVRGELPGASGDRQFRMYVRLRPDAVDMTLRFNTRSGDAPVLRLLWRRENGEWRITSYHIELP